MDDSPGVNTGGGANVAGDVATGGGDFVGRDNIVNVFADVEALQEMVSVLQGARVRLAAQSPADGLDALETVLDEISKVHTLIESELVRYLSLSFDPAGDILSERASLVAMEGGAVQARASEARGHCHKIDAIYRKQLRGWFQSSLSPEEFALVDSAFDRLGTADVSMIYTLDQLAAWLAGRAVETLDLVDAGSFDAANKLVREARRAALPLRQAMAQSMVEMRNLQAELIAASAAKSD